jgi:uncharacterized membrane protein
MTIGPLQLVLVKFSDAQQMSKISDEIKAARRSGIIRLVDLFIIHKDLNGVLQEKSYTDLAESQKAEYGLVLRGLLGMRAAYKTAGEVDQITSAMSLTPGDFGITSQQIPQIVDALPNGGTALLTLFEHTWAVKLKEALLNAGGELIAQGLLSPEVMALGGTTLEEAVAAAQKIETDAEQAVAAQVAEADEKLAQAKAEAEAKLAEAQRVLAEAETESAARMEQAKLVAAAAIAASVRTAADELQQADQSKKEIEAQLEQSRLEIEALREQNARDAAEAEARLEQSRLEIEALREQSKRDAAATVALGVKLAGGQIQAGQRTAEEVVEQGIQTAEEIKAAAVTEALRILLEAQLVKREATRQAIAMLVSASLIEQAAAEESYARLMASAPTDAGF